jgi:signal transduction histidine kinase
LVTAARERFQPTALQQRIALDMSVDQNLANVRADPDRLARVLDNLISNALKFTPEGGRVVLQVERRADHLLITITDSGDGIAPEALPHVFDEFYQGTGDKKRQGVGLGLAIVKHIVNAHGGVVEAKSEGCGKGSTFTVMLPCEARTGTVKHSIATA